MGAFHFQQPTLSHAPVQKTARIPCNIGELMLRKPTNITERRLLRRSLLAEANLPVKYVYILQSEQGTEHVVHFAATKSTQAGSVASLRRPVGVSLPVAASTRKITTLADSWFPTKR